MEDQELENLLILEEAGRYQSRMNPRYRQHLYTMPVLRRFGGIYLKDARDTIVKISIAEDKTGTTQKDRNHLDVLKLRRREAKQGVRRILGALRKECTFLMRLYSRKGTFMEGEFNQIYTSAIALHKRTKHHSLYDYAWLYYFNVDSSQAIRSRNLYNNIYNNAVIMEHRILQLGGVHCIEVHEMIRPSDNPRIKEHLSY